MPERPTTSASVPSRPGPRHTIGRAIVLGALGLFGLLLFAQAVLSSAAVFAPFASAPTWQSVVTALGATPVPGDPTQVDVALLPVAMALLPAVALVVFVGSAALSRSAGVSISSAAVYWGDCAAVWLLLPGGWWLASTFGLLVGWASAGALLDATVDLWASVAIAGCIAAWFSARCELRAGPVRQPAARWLLVVILISGLTFTALNWGLWFNLRIPHGDSAMYEEHLWNIEHGKGFRSYLDQGLFLGEHVQVIHLLLLPLHWLWPSQMLLEVCQAFAMATGAIPIYRMASRFSGCRRAALLLATAYLLYFPLQYLDITIDLKTFRPNSLGVPALLFALDALERGRKAACVGWLALMLSAQEDYAIVISLLGTWVMLTAGGAERGDNAAPRWSPMAALRRIVSTGARPQVLFGGALAAFGVVYLLVVMKVVFPYFRDGATIHYASYFSRFGQTPDEIVWTILTRPDRVLAELITVPAMIYAAALLVPLGGLPLRSPGRALVAAPLFGLLCLNDLALQPPAPVHHFHAPLVPLLFWAAAAALRPGGSGQAANSCYSSSVQRARFACLCALASGVFMSMTPLGLKFWDAGGARSWRTLYVAGDRARQFATIDALIPQDARVASTDFVHARLTHRERSYDYSNYVRRVADYEDRVPRDTEWIVIDIEHPYHSPEEVVALREHPDSSVRELREAPQDWRLVEHAASRYFIVLQRRHLDER